MNAIQNIQIFPRETIQLGLITCELASQLCQRLNHELDTIVGKVWVVDRADLTGREDENRGNRRMVEELSEQGCVIK